MEQRNFRLKQEGISNLEKLLFKVSKRRYFGKKEVILKSEINETETSVYHGLMPTENEPFDNPLKCTNEVINSIEEARIERDLLIHEYRDGHEWGKHWDLLRWSVSKFFLSIQTVFVIAALKGLFDLNAEAYTNHNTLIMRGVMGLGLINIILCIMWCIRNEGIHAWHRAAITRQRMIELDPRLRQTVAFYSTITRRLSKWCHITGELECWGPPLAFILLWCVIIVLSILKLLK